MAVPNEWAKLLMQQQQAAQQAAQQDYGSSTQPGLMGQALGGLLGTLGAPMPETATYRTNKKLLLLEDI